jgi:hypothetical protein
MACVFVEFLVIWPVPLTDVAHSGYLVDLGDQAGRGAVLNLPLSAGHVKEMGLFYQTVHRRPVFDCWFQRPLDAAPGVAGFLDGLLYPPAERDIIPTPDAALQAQVARAEGVGHVLLFLPYVDRPQERGAMLASTFGLPVSEEGAISVYRVPTDLPSPADLVYALPNETWPAVEDWGGHPARWLEERGELMIWAPEAMEGLLRFSALPLRTPERLQVAVNDHALPPLVIGQRLTYTTPSFSLQSGVNRVDLRSLNGCTSYVGDPRCGGLSLALAAEAAGCSPYIREERCLSILLQDVRFLPQAASVSQLGGEIDVGVGDSFRLLGYDLEGESWPGDPLRVTIRWQAEQAPSLDAVLFVHLLGPDGQVAAQHDAPPLLGTYPTTRWAPGDIFVQRVSLTLPSDAESGRYRLLAGMYIYPDLVRLPVSGSRPHAQDGLVWLTDIEID